MFYLINMIGWSGLILVMFGNGIRNIAAGIRLRAGGAGSSGLGVALGLWLSYLVATRGVHLLKISNAFVTPGLGLLIAFMFYMLIRDHGWEAIAAAPPLDPSPKPFINYLLAVELGIASGISWWGGVGFLARNTRTRRNAIYPEILQLGLATGIACSIGLFSALVVQSEDPTEWMVPLGGVFMGVLALVFVALANVTSTAVSLFASGLALRHVPATALASVVAADGAAGAPLRSVRRSGPASSTTWATRSSPTTARCTPHLGHPVHADYFMLRGQRLDLWSIFDDAPSGDYFYTRGFNWIALGSLVLGQATYLFLYNPLTGATHELFTLGARFDRRVRGPGTGLRSRDATSVLEYRARSLRYPPRRLAHRRTATDRPEHLAGLRGLGVG